MCVRVKQIHTHNIHTLTCRQMQAFNRPLCHAHTHACTRTYIITRTHTLTSLLENGVRIREGEVYTLYVYVLGSGAYAGFKKGGLHVGRDQLWGGYGRGMCPFRREPLKPSGAVPFEDIISLRNSTFS